MKIQTQNLTGPALDWAVARAGGGAKDIRMFLAAHVDYDMYHYSTSWQEGGPIIEREKIALTTPRWDGYWTALKIVEEYDERWSLDGPTPLIAAMRCYVASKLGDTVDIPEELL